MFLQRQRQPQQQRKMDNLFFNAIKRAKQSYYKRAGLHLFKAILLVVFLIVDTSYLKSSQWKLTVLMKLGIAVSIINLLIKLLIIKVGYRNGPTNNNFFLSLSKATGHQAQQQFLNDPSDINDLNMCVSPYLYNQVNGAAINDPVLTDSLRSKYENINANLIQSQVLQKRKCLPLVDLLGRVLSLIAIIYGVVALTTSNPNIPQIIVLSFYLIFESFNIWAVLLFILFIIFLPFICCFGCIYLCIYGSRAFVNRDNLIIPQATKASAQVIEKADGNCTVCLQNFKLNEKVITLPCSQKHVFHESCIMSWFRVSNSCPICRAPVPSSI